MIKNLDKFQKVPFMSMYYLNQAIVPWTLNCNYFMNTLSGIVGVDKQKLLSIIGYAFEEISYIYSRTDYHFVFEKLFDIPYNRDEEYKNEIGQIIERFISLASVSLIRKGGNYIRLFIDNNPQYEQILRKKKTGSDEEINNNDTKYSGTDVTSTEANNSTNLKNEVQPINSVINDINNPSAKSEAIIDNTVDVTKTHGMNIKYDSSKENVYNSSTEYETITGSAKVKFYQDLESLVQYIRKEWFDPYIIELSCNNY